ncbi:hypothetical protein [Acidipila sp. EB88]|nr:hypothetical protein [Acidipila sp. EB88]
MPRSLVLSRTGAPGRVLLSSAQARMVHTFTPGHALSSSVVLEVTP